MVLCSLANAPAPGVLGRKRTNNLRQLLTPVVENSLSHGLAWAGFPICRVCPVLATTAPPGSGLRSPLTSLLLSGPSALAKTPAPPLATPRTGLPFRPSQRARLTEQSEGCTLVCDSTFRTSRNKVAENPCSKDFVHLEKLPPVEQWARRHRIEKLSNARRCLPSESQVLRRWALCP